MQERANVFISATTADLGSYRLAVRDVLLDRGVHPILQDHLEPDYQTMMAILRQAIDACDAVICLVGFVYGQEPKRRPAGAPRRSYTQLEFDIAEAFDKPIYVFLAYDQCPCDPHPDELPELRQLQLEHRERLRQRPHKREYFESLADLRYRIATIPFAEPGMVVDKPHNLPYISLGPHFKGREPFLAELRQKLTATPGAAAAIIARQAIHGLGGVGKTCLAVEYAWRYQAEYTALLFVLADTPANLRRNLAALVGPLVLNLAEQQAQEEEVQVTAALHWLEAHHGWLLILDNVDTEDAAQAVEHLLPRLRRGHVLITSRLTLWHGAEPLALDARALAEALRVQVYWAVAGLGESVAAHYLQQVRSEMSWIRQAVRACSLGLHACSSAFAQLSDDDKIARLASAGWLASGTITTGGTPHTTVPTAGAATGA